MTEDEKNKVLSVFALKVWVNWSQMLSYRMREKKSLHREFWGLVQKADRVGSDYNANVLGNVGLFN